MHSPAHNVQHVTNKVQHRASCILIMVYNNNLNIWIDFNGHHKVWFKKGNRISAYQIDAIHNNLWDSLECFISHLPSCFLDFASAALTVVMGFGGKGGIWGKQFISIKILSFGAHLHSCTLEQNEKYREIVDKTNKIKKWQI